MSFNQCEILLVDSAFAKGTTQAVGRFRCPGEDDCPAGDRVESADDTQVHVARFIVFLFDVSFCEFEQRHPVVARSHRGEARPFVDDEQVVILE